MVVHGYEVSLEAWTQRACSEWLLKRVCSRLGCSTCGLWARSSLQSHIIWPGGLSTGPEIWQRGSSSNVITAAKIRAASINIGTTPLPSDKQTWEDPYDIVP